MNTPVEHRATSSGTAADPGGLPADQVGSVLAGTERSAPPAVPAQPSQRAVPAELRGRTDISNRVVSRIAAGAAREVARVRKVGEQGPLSFRGGTRAAVDGTLATLRLDVTVEYPAPIREVADEVRRHVAERIMTLTGMEVGHIDIDVTNVTRAPENPAESPAETSHEVSGGLSWAEGGNQPDFRTPDTAAHGTDVPSREEGR
ncbi:Asp23/Gls24 family envelope stress response protein [Streptosporangium sp. NBC_01755]|uniref:Asp23/Gls24 family envelope stress response protein n=1 Tax=unclassified Streptosporangium TaxID=2632669 RepID=UPI002DDBBAC9|nr:MULTISPECIES: Asp23/Gls24 family envelope stress response protein [unclassified Streptosporangium]WSA26545.1 Asp23/Gls24 family envelope stress response protein [Streptosporangium sp. NBC_01810]WSD02032.1 Asp23/Gls24 family envelope stress response protein [Streptosporangium sp. NBC_01755]